MNLAIVQEIRTTNTPSGHGRALYRVSVYRGDAWGDSPIPVGPHKGARHAHAATSYHVDDYGDRGYRLERPSEWHVIDAAPIYTNPSRWNGLAKGALPGVVTIGLDGARY